MLFLRRSRAVSSLSALSRLSEMNHCEHRDSVNRSGFKERRNVRCDEVHRHTWNSGCPLACRGEISPSLEVGGLGEGGQPAHLIFLLSFSRRWKQRIRFLYLLQVYEGGS